MKITDFIRLQNRKLVENASISFKLLLPTEYGGKWFFYCEHGKTVEELCEFVKKSNIDMDITFPWNQVSIEEEEEEAENESEELIYTYVFDLNDYHEDPINKK